MGEIKVNDKEVVVPGETLALGMEFLPSYGTYREGDRILASRLGLVNIDGKVIKLVPLSGVYHPKKGDTIIGPVTEILLSGWRIDTNSAYSAVLNMKDATSEFIARGADLTRYFAIGDYVMAKIINVTSQNLVDLTMKGPGLRKLKGGRIIHINANKVPRIIGKQGSMVSMIKQYTNCRILVGQNGIVWLQGDEPSKELLAVETIKKIEREAHIPGLTDSIKDFLEKNKEGITK
ncbi:exosome complex protein Rrp4 [Candidatus Woesearchaeota archaeon]|nr:exosome complex protein Rrp4 [Candidatus Woesearchaeota archaeon]